MAKFIPFLCHFDSLNSIKKMGVTYDSRKKPSIYSFQLLRYFFAFGLIKNHWKSISRQIDVLEVGIDKGQMNEYFFSTNLDHIINDWDGLDVEPNYEYLNKLSYNHIYECNAEKDLHLNNKKYDVIILLHLLEHLHKPEAFLDRLLPHVKDDGIIIGGVPTMPDIILPFWEKKLRKKPKKKFGHVSVISPPRVIRYTESRNLCVTFFSGAYFFRKTGSFIENSFFTPIWLRVNLLFGYLFPSIGSELYFSFKKEG